MNKYPVDSAPLFHLDGFGLLARAATRVRATRKKRSWRSGERGQAQSERAAAAHPRARVRLAAVVVVAVVVVVAAGGAGAVVSLR